MREYFENRRGVSTPPFLRASSRRCSLPSSPEDLPVVLDDIGGDSDRSQEDRRQRVVSRSPERRLAAVLSQDRQQLKGEDGIEVEAGPLRPLAQLVQEPADAIPLHGAAHHPHGEPLPGALALLIEGELIGHDEQLAERRSIGRVRLLRVFDPLSRRDLQPLLDIVAELGERDHLSPRRGSCPAMGPIVRGGTARVAGKQGAMRKKSRGDLKATKKS